MAASKKHLTPAELVVARFGGSRKLSRLLGYDESTVTQWCIRGGAIPSGSKQRNNHKRLLQLAKKCGVGLSADELVFGGVA